MWLQVPWEQDWGREGQVWRGQGWEGQGQWGPGVQPDSRTNTSAGLLLHKTRPAPASPWGWHSAAAVCVKVCVCV